MLGAQDGQRPLGLDEPDRALDQPHEHKGQVSAEAQGQAALSRSTWKRKGTGQQSLTLRKQDQPAEWRSGLWLMRACLAKADTKMRKQPPGNHLKFGSGSALTTVPTGLAIQ